MRRARRIARAGFLDGFYIRIKSDWDDLQDIANPPINTWSNVACLALVILTLFAHTSVFPHASLEEVASVGSLFLRYRA
ncbi:hypothetical protein KCP73_10485 [Salmonella enterica subsp. enterica]|nr:hypothetical protein KCP73_10485 [Salmonella enterica subsp. enterica]